MTTLAGMTPDTVARWIDGYLAAWRTYDPERIGSLFSESATYAFNPWDEPLVGREAIVAAWLGDKDAPGSWRAEYHPVLVLDGTAIIVGETEYTDGSVYSNLFQVSFDTAGRCTSFVEWYMDRTNTD